MQDFNTMEAEFFVPLNHRGMYQNLHHLLAEGHKLPLLTSSGTRVGHAHRCSVHDEVRQGLELMLRMSMSFVVNKPFEGKMIDMQPVCLTYYFDSRAKFSILSHFNLIVAPVF